MEESVRIVVLDFYMSSPIPGLDVTYSDFRGASVNQVAILRCFGSTKNGKKICVHIHGVFPYLYIPYDGAGNAEGLMYQIAAGIDKAVNTSLNQGTSLTQHVYKISLVSGIPMYGYHPKKHQFFKVYLYNPMLVSTVANLLLNHSILDRVFQPHEAHINFTLQFMIDYNLHGMSNMIVSKMKFRMDPENPNTDIDTELFLPASIEKITTCELEADINAENIFNRQEILSGNLAVNPGIAALWADEQQRRRNKNEDSQLGQFLELNNLKCTPTKTHLMFQQLLTERLAVLSTDKVEIKENLNISVYPAETPNHSNIQNASLIDIHTPSSLELSLDDTINLSTSQNLDYTVTSTQSHLSVAMDEDANNFLQLLQTLAEEKATENTTEEDCILSQNTKEDEPHDGYTEEFLDLSMPLAAVTTPRKVDTEDISIKSDDEDENYFNTTLIPQTDGQTEMSDSGDERIIVRSTLSNNQVCQKYSSNPYSLTDSCRKEKTTEKPHCGKSMPLLDMNILQSNWSANLMDPLNKLNMYPTVKLHRVTPIVKIERHVMSGEINILTNHRKTRQCAQKTQEEKIEENLRLIRFRINKMNTKSRLKRIKNGVNKKDIVMGTLLKKFLRPKFNIISGRKWFLESHQKDVANSPIISRIIKQTRNYTDPTLYLLAKHPSDKKFLYYYGGQAIPEITEIPSSLSESECEKIISCTQKSDTLKNRKKAAIMREKIKILHNKILNIKQPKHIKEEHKFKILGEIGMNKETPYEIKFDDLPEELKVVVSQISKPLDLELSKEYGCLAEDGKFKNFEMNLLDEIKQANLTLQKHVQQLKDFGVYKAAAKEENVFSLKEVFLDRPQCLNNGNFTTNENKTGISFLFEAEGPCELPISKEVNIPSGGIQNVNKANNISGSESPPKKCHPKILNSFSGDYNAKENVSEDSNVRTLIRLSKTRKPEKCYQTHNKKRLSRCKGLSCSTYDSTIQIYHSLNKNYSLSDECYSNYDTSVESDDNLRSFTNPQHIKSKNILVAGTARPDLHCKLENKFDTPSSDSDYMSLSTNSLGKNASYEFECSPSNKSVSVLPELHVGLSDLPKSPEALTRIYIPSDAMLDRPLHVHCLPLSVSCGVFGTNENSVDNGAEIGHEKISDIIGHYQSKSKPMWDHTYTQPYNPKRIQKRRRSTPNMYINCDGAVDSSSDDEENIRTKSKKHARRSRTLSQYAPLQISVSKSPRVPGNGLGAGLADNMAGISGDQTNFHGTSEINQERPLSKSCVSIKRKLLFESGIPLNNTISEEFLSCVYLTKNISKRTISTVSTNSEMRISRENDTPQSEKADTDSDQNSTNSQSQNDSNSVVETTYSDSDLFSEDEDANKSFFRNYTLSTSEKYDKETRYKAKEGCSNVFTPSIAGHATVLSQENPSKKVLSDNTSTDITPYQESTNKGYYRTLSNILSSEHESSDILPYQNLKQLGNDKSQTKLSSFVTSKVFKSAFCAPTRLQIETSLNELKIPENTIQEPFYSNVEDYTGAVEVGHNTLRISSRATCHLSDFKSDFDSLVQFRKWFTENVSNLIWNLNNLKNLKLSHCNNKNVIIRPVKIPPSVKIVHRWLEGHSSESKLTSTSDKNNIRSKIYIPNSPGNDEDDLELSLSITPSTPVPSQVILTQSSEPVTAKSSLNSQSSSPVLHHRKNKNVISKPFRLRESLLSSEEINKSCQITGVFQNNSFGFSKSTQNLQAARVVVEYQNLTTMVMELHIRTRGDLKPDPEYDPICAIVYSVLNDVPETHTKKPKAKGVVALNCLPIYMGIPNDHFLDGICINCDITYAETEEAVINEFLSLINYWDPDILAGYEIQMLSWGYLIDRAFVLSINIIPLMGRSEINKYGRLKQKTTNYEIETAITGRIILDVWRIMRHEVALQSYTFESIVYHILHKRVPMFAFKDFTFWWDHRTNLYRHRVLSYYLLRVETVLELFDKLDFLNRTSELARLFGILFYEVLSRGSQFRVESMMLRLAKPLNYVPVSPNTLQRSRMKAPEYIALVMEPESKLYNDPVIVLDFQSLYPSIIISYNYCFTTCVGRVSCLETNTPYEFGATQLKMSKKVLEKLSKRNLLNFSPCGVAFVKQKVRQGILPRMLTEILDTRLMVKNSMKENKGNENLQKVLHSRQLGLKLIANVTYGYTAANFSGRMCCVEVGDSVVSKARETLQRAIALVESTTEWGARVVYGDTDSLFVLVPGKSKEMAFEVGKKIADAITADNPDPVKLKLEKVYQPCILQTKKRYVGYMYESPDQKEPIYDAKGIETVRRDGCPAVSKMLQKCLTLLFETKDVSLIKKYILRQFNKIQAGRASIQDLTFAKEYRGASGYKPGACVPALELARKWKGIDRRSEPRSGERVPYIIVSGPPGLPLIRLVRSPRDILNDSSLRPNSLYYITKVIIPPINRCLNLIGADLHTWFNKMPRKHMQYLPNSSPIIKSTISQYFVSKICASCSQPAQNGLCDRCYQNVNITAFTLEEKLRKWEENFYNTKLICHSCTGHLNEIVCVSLDCPVLYRRTQTYSDLQQSTYVRELLASTDIFSHQSDFDGI